MAYAKIFNYLDTMMRSDDNKRLIPVPFGESIVVKPGYYSKDNESIVNKEELRGKEDPEISQFQYKGQTYKRRDEVLYTVECGIGAFTNLLKSMTWTKSELSSAELHLICERLTAFLWENIAAPILKMDPDDLIQKKYYSVDGNNLTEDMFAGLYSIVYFLMYDVVAKDRCEISTDLIKVEENINNLDTHWGTDSKMDVQIRKILGLAVDHFVGRFIQPYITVEIAKVGQAHVNENLTSIMAEYKDLKTKVTYIMGGHIDDWKNFIVLEEYINMIIGQEQSFVELLKLIMSENLDKDLEKLQERLTIEGDYLENFLRRLITTNIEYVTKNIESVKQIKRKLANNIPTKANKTEMTIVKVMNDVMAIMDSGFKKSVDSADKVPVVKIINSKCKTYSLKAVPNISSNDTYKRVEALVRILGRELSAPDLEGITKKTITRQDDRVVNSLKLHYFSTLTVNIITGIEQGQTVPTLEIIYEDPNLGDFNINTLTWDTLTIK